MTGMLVYYSSATGNTHRFVTKTGLPAKRLGPQGDGLSGGEPDRGR